MVFIIQGLNKNEIFVVDYAPITISTLTIFHIHRGVYAHDRAC